VLEHDRPIVLDVLIEPHAIPSTRIEDRTASYICEAVTRANTVVRNGAN